MKQDRLYTLAGLLCGAVFGFGLALSQMTNPEKVVSFLNIAGGWDPSLAFTMAGAVLVTSLGYRLVLRRGPILCDDMHLPTRTDIDTRLVGGALIFGVGWGLAGYCPGPALTGLGGGSLEPVVFVLAMITGGQVSGLLERRLRPAMGG